jgi:hypothetical protein
MVYRPSNGTLQVVHRLCHSQRQTQVVNQVTWLPQKPCPRIKSQDLLRVTIQDVIALLNHPPTETLIGVLEHTHSQCGELIQMMNVLHQHTARPQLNTSEVTASSLGVGIGMDPPQYILDTIVPTFNEVFGGTAINKDTGTQAENKK